MSKGAELTGRELDAAVNDKVMCKCVAGVPHDDRNTPHYSSSIADAMKVWEKLRQSGEWCCLTIKSDYNYVWDVSLTRSDGATHVNPAHVPTVKVSGDVLMEVICRAALEGAAALAAMREDSK